MPICGGCGRESAFAFCPFCGTRLTPPGQPLRELRKTVTVLFCDVADSTALGESVDPEALRALLVRYSGRMKSIVEAHGGTLEKFIGDAVMAVFGLPSLHEDDALRACRAAVEMRDALPGLGISGRVGLYTGEVVTGTEERLATGDAVNVASRLEQAAAPGEILIGAETLRLVRDVVEVGDERLLELRGKSRPLPAYPLVAVADDKPAARAGVPMVGRRTELTRLRAAFAQAVHDRSCQLFTVLGAAGVGKSRLAAELLRELDARVVTGRCLSYGDGITYWPAVEVLRQLGELPTDEDAASALRSLLGESDEGTSAEQIAWAFRKLLEEQARVQPLVCVVDDLHWAEETFLDLVEHVADLARDAPILLLCLSRPELLERRPAWGGGTWNATNVLLEPLDPGETDQLVDALGGVEASLQERIREASEGNPLFVEEMVALVREAGDSEVVVPPTIQALLAARLDQLDPAEREVLERGAIEGRVFHRGAVEALSDSDLDIGTTLMALVRKELLRPELERRDGDAFRFRHQLIRDAAYDALPKAVRATLHERFASWVEARRADVVELEEIVGHHLERAARYRAELGEHDAALAETAGMRLAAAGRRALWRGDNHAAAGLLERALELLRPLRPDVHLELDLASALWEHDPRQAAAIADAAAEQARTIGDRPGEAVALVVASFQRLLTSDAGADELEQLARAAIPILEEAGDHDGLVHVWHALGFGVANVRCAYAEWAEASEQALLHARLAGQRPTHLFNLEIGLVLGPRPADEALAKLDALLPESASPYPLVFRAHLLAMLGRFDEAWPSAFEASARLRELTGGADGADYTLADIATLAGDHEKAARYLRAWCDFLEERRQPALLSTYAAMLGRSLCALGLFEEAEQQARLSRDVGEEHDIATQAHWRQVQALVDSQRGRHVEAEALAREAVDLIDRTDALNFQAAVLCDLAEVLRNAGRADEAAAAFEDALERYDRKRNRTASDQVRDRLASLRGEALPA
jgi:class 3 adenylate cyclase/tetratricopeptide (TPR) repeat protein